jgi:hypothetical protein
MNILLLLLVYTRTINILAFDFEWHPSIQNSFAIGQLVCGKNVYIIDVVHMNHAENLKWISLMEEYTSNNSSSSSRNQGSNRVLVGFGASSDLKILSKMKNSAIVNGNAITNGSSSNAKKRKSSSIVANEIFDLQKYTSGTKITGTNRKQKQSLASMVNAFYGNNKLLNKTCTMTNWLRRPLGQPQIEYAALDAIVCLKMYHQIMKMEEHRTCSKPAV